MTNMGLCHNNELCFKVWRVSNGYLSITTNKKNNFLTSNDKGAKKKKSTIYEKYLL